MAVASVLYEETIDICLALDDKSDFRPLDEASCDQS
jgi:hypothetical protein